MSLNFSHPQKSGWAMAHMAHMPTRPWLGSLYRGLSVHTYYFQKNIHNIHIAENDGLMV